MISCLFLIPPIFQVNFWPKLFQPENLMISPLKTIFKLKF